MYYLRVLRVLRGKEGKGFLLNIRSRNMGKLHHEGHEGHEEGNCPEKLNHRYYRP